MARADALFNAAKALIDAGQYTDACGKFAESRRLAPGLGVTLYLADCYERIGRVASAWTEFRSAEGLARERSDKRAELARARAQALEPKLARLTIALSPLLPRSGLTVLRDGVSVPQDELGLPVPVDPGDHVVVVSSPGHKPRTFTAHAGPESPTVQVDSLDEPGPSPAPEAPASASSAASPTPGPTSPGSAPASTAAPNAASVDARTVSATTPGATQRWIGVAVAGVGVVGVGLGSVFGLAAKSKLDQSNSGSPPPCNASDMCSRDGLSLRHDAQGAAAASNVAFVAGGVALAAGAVLYLTAPRASAGTGVIVAPAPVAGGGGAWLQGRF